MRTGARYQKEDRRFSKDVLSCLAVLGWFTYVPRMVSRLSLMLLALLWALAFTPNSHAAPPPAALKLKLRLMAEGFVSPSVAVSLGGKAGQMVVADQAGVARVMETDGSLREEAFLDLTSRMVKLNPGFDERGLLGLALHPKFASNRKIYVFYSAPRRLSAPADWDHTCRVSEFQVRKENRLRVDLASERVVLEIDKPYFNHNGGSIAFGPDGYLYIAVGDGGGGNGQGKGHSPISNGQDLGTLLGKILRIDVDRGTPYGIPRDNPFVSGQGKPEIFAYGLRNPYRMSFDRGGNRDLLVGDVGQTLFEEVNLVVNGGNYGWFIREGDVCFNPKDAKNPLPSCAQTGADGKTLIGPVLQYKNPNGFQKDPEAFGISVIGGFVYRGKALAKLQGAYVFGDWSRNWGIADGLFLLGRKQGAGEKWLLEQLSPVLADGGKWKGYITAFGEDADGELYVLSNASNGVVGRTGKVWKMVGVE